MSLLSIIDHRSPQDALALTGPEIELTIADIRARADLLETEALALGIASGHRIGLLLQDAPDTLIAVASLLFCARVMPLNPALTAAELSAQISDAALDAVICDHDHPVLSSLTRPVLALTPDGLRGSALAASVPGDAGLLLLTSGSTGDPKRVPLRPEQLLHSAQTIAKTLHLGSEDGALHALPMFHIGAIVDLFLAPLVSGGAVHVSAGRTPDALAQTLRTRPVTWMQLVPTMLARVMAEWPTDAALSLSQPLRFVRSVSSDLSQERQAEAEAFLGGKPLIQMYGMTESAGQITSNPLPPALRKPGSVGTCNGAEVAIVSPDGVQLDPRMVGEICVRGPGVTSGYEGIDRSKTHFGDWLRSGDLGQLDEDGYLFLTGRMKEMINRGGEKISPLEIERAALRVDGVAEAASFAEPHPTLGEQVALAVVPRPGATLDEKALLADLSHHLAEFKRPRRVRILDALPRLGSGKVNKHALLQDAGTAARPQALSGDAARIAQLWQTVLQSAPPLPEDDFFDMGGDSLSATEFLLTLEKELGRSVPMTALFEAPRFAAFVDHIATSRAQQQDTDPLLAFLAQHTAGWQGTKVGDRKLVHAVGTVEDKAPFFLCAQGHVQKFREVFAARPLYIMHSLWKKVDPTDADLEQITALYVEEIMALRPEGRLYIGGYCAGGRVMRHVADALHARGRDIAFLVSIDHWYNEPTAYPVLHVFTESPTHSAAMRFVEPERALPVLHPAGAAAFRVTGRHSDAIITGAMKPLGAEVERWIAKGALPCVELGSLPAPLRHRAWSARLALSGPRYHSRARPQAMQVSVTNTSDVEWGPTDQSGIAATLHLDNLDGVRRVRMAAHHRFDLPVAPGETVTFDMPVTYPATGVPLIAKVTMTDEGFTEFPGAEGGYARRLIWTNPFRTP